MFRNLVRKIHVYKLRYCTVYLGEIKKKKRKQKIKKPPDHSFANSCILCRMKRLVLKFGQNLAQIGKNLE